MYGVIIERFRWVLDTSIGDYVLLARRHQIYLCQQDEDFPDVSAFHRRALFNKVVALRQAAERRQLQTVDLSGYTTINVKKDKAALIMGKGGDVNLWRSL